MIKDTITDRREDIGEFQYYRLHDTPIRIVISKDGNVMGSNGLNVDTGELVIGSYISEVDNNPNIEEITEEEFYNLCKDLVEQNKKPTAGI